MYIQRPRDFQGRHQKSADINVDLLAWHIAKKAPPKKYTFWALQNIAGSLTLEAHPLGEAE